MSLCCSFILMLMSLGITIPHTTEKCLGLIGIGFLISLAYGIFRAPKKQKVAELIDATGLNERVSTALMLIEEETPLSKLQREDTWRSLEHYNIKKHFPWQISVKRVGLNLMLSLVLIGMAMIPTQAKQQEKAMRLFEKEKSTLTKELEAAKEKLSLEQSLTDEDKKQLKEIIDKAIKEIPEIKDETELEKAMERLDKKFEKKINEIEDQKGQASINAFKEQLLGQFKEQLSEKAKQDLSSLKETFDKNTVTKALADVLSETEQKEDAVDHALEKIEKQMTKLSETEKKALANTFSEAAKQVTDASLSEALAQASQAAEQGKLDAEALKNAIEQLKESAEVNQKTQEEKEQGQGQGEGEGKGAGKGQGEGKGTGKGQGKGQGEGQGEDKGQGWDLGSKNGKEEATNGQTGAIDETDALGEREQLSGQHHVGEEQNIQNEIPYGLNIAGEKVDYHEVIGDYTDKALENIDEEAMPEQMKDVIKTYFEAINE